MCNNINGGEDGVEEEEKISSHYSANNNIMDISRLSHRYFLAKGKKLF